MASGSLRERGKERRRLAIQKAAFRLFAEQGYQPTTIAEIAAEAEVAPRTVSLYFPTKTDIALSRANEASQRLTRMLGERVPGESTFDVIGRWLQCEVEETDPEVHRLAVAMYRANPALHGLTSAQLSQAFDAGTRAFAAEVGLALDHIVVRIVRGAFAGIAAEYLTVIAEGKPPEVTPETAVRFLTAGTAAITTS